MGLARELAERIAAMQYSDLSEEAVYWGKIALLDTVGVTLAGAREDAPRLLDEVVGAGSGPSLVFGSNRFWPGCSRLPIPGPFMTTATASTRSSK